ASGEAGGGNLLGLRRCSPAQLRKIAHRAPVRGSRKCCISHQGLRYHALAVYRFPGLVTTGFHRCTTAGKFFVADRQMDTTVGNVDFDDVPIFDQTDIAAFCRFGGSVADDQTRRTTGEASVRQQSRGSAQAFRLQIRRGVEHFLHAGAALGAFVADDDDITGLDLVAENPFNRVFLAFEHASTTGKGENAFINTGRLHNAAVNGHVPVEHRQAAVLGVGVLDRADAAVLAVHVQFGVIGVLAEGFLAADVAGSRLVELFDLVRNRGIHDVPGLKGLAQGAASDVAYVKMQQVGTGQFGQNAQNAAGTMNVFDMVFVSGRSKLAQAGNTARQTVDVRHGEINASFLRSCQQVQHRVGGATHGDIQRHGIFECLERRNIARQYGVIVLLVVTAAQLDNLSARIFEEFLAAGVGG